MDKILQQISDYFKDNPILFWIAVALAAVIVILIIVAIVTGVKKSKAKKNAAVSEEEDVPAEQPKAVAAPQSVAVETQKQEPQKTAPAQTAAPAQAETEPAQKNTQAADVQESAPQQQTAESAKPEQTVKAEPAETKPAAPAAEKKPAAAKPEEKPVTEPYAAAANPERVASRNAAEKLLKKSEEDDEEKKPAYTGKWVIFENEETGSYYFELRASNGEKLFTSIEYTSLSGAKNGIKTHKNNILKGNIVISQNKKKLYFFKILTGSKQLLCTGETYASRSNCESAVESVKRFAETAVIVLNKKDEDEEN